MDPLTIAGVVAIIVFSLGVHEAAHAWSAYRLGDPTAYRLGRMTVNPLPHIDLFWTILLPIMLLVVTNGSMVFGGAKPVPVDPRNLRNPHRDMALVAAAGPVSNLVQAVLWAGLLSVLLHTEMWAADSQGVQIIILGIWGNILLAVFNMLPVPPLDGSRVVALLFGPEGRNRYLAASRFSLVGLILALQIPMVRELIFAPVYPLFELILQVTMVPGG